MAFNSESKKRLIAGAKASAKIQKRKRQRRISLYNKDPNRTYVDEIYAGRTPGKFVVVAGKFTPRPHSS